MTSLENIVSVTNLGLGFLSAESTAAFSAAVDIANDMKTRVEGSLAIDASGLVHCSLKGLSHFYGLRVVSEDQYFIRYGFRGDETTYNNLQYQKIALRVATSLVLQCFDMILDFYPHFE